jgi:nucleoside-diphosphate-sugar epimerase
MAESFLFAIKNKSIMKNEVFNIGSDTMNYSKKEVCEIINRHVSDVLFHYADFGEDVDKRNYKVSYEKINKLGFKTKISMEDGISEIIKAYGLIQINSPFHNS